MSTEQIVFRRVSVLPPCVLFGNVPPAYLIEDSNEEERSDDDSTVAMNGHGDGDQ